MVRRHKSGYWVIFPHKFVILLLLLFYLIIVYTLALCAITKLFHLLKLIHIWCILKTANTHWFGYCCQKASLSDSSSAFQNQSFTVPSIFFHSNLETSWIRLRRFIINKIDIVTIVRGLLPKVVEILDPFLNFLSKIGLKKLIQCPWCILINP